MQSAPPRSTTYRASFSLVTGGPFYHLLVRTRLARAGCFSAGRPIAFSLLITAAPMLVLAFLQLVLADTANPSAKDIALLVRSFLGVPLLLLGEEALHVSCKRSVEGFVRVLEDDGELERFERTLQRAERVRDRGGLELGFLLVALFVSQATLWNAFGFGDALRGTTAREPVTPVRVFYYTIALPLFQFLFLRWSLHWLVWSLVLLRACRINYQLEPMHPDGAGGIGQLSAPGAAFSLYAAAASSVVAAEWGLEVVGDEAALSKLVLPAVLLVATANIMAYSPLLAFFPGLLRGRSAGIRDYSFVALVQERAFRDRWIRKGPDPSILGAPEISALADFQTAYEGMLKMRLVPFGPRALLAVTLGVVAPMLPIVALIAPIPELLLDIAKALFLGAPTK